MLLAISSRSKRVFFALSDCELNNNTTQLEVRNLSDKIRRQPLLGTLWMEGRKDIRGVRTYVYENFAENAK